MFATQITGWVFLVVFIPIVIIFSFLFQKRIHKFPIFARFPSMVVFVNIFTFSHICIASTYLILDSPKWICFVNRFAVFLGFPLYGNAYLLRSWYLFFTFRLQKSILKLHDSQERKGDVFIQNMNWKRKVRLAIIYFVIAGIALVIFVPLSEKTEVYNYGNNSCSKGNFEMISAFLSIFFGCLIIIFGFLLWGVKENMYIKVELKAVGAIWILMVILYIIGVTLVPSGQSLKRWETGFYTVIPTVEFLAFLISTVMPVIVSYRNEKPISKPADNSSSSFFDITLDGVLSDKLLRTRFQEFLCQEFCVENLLFWEAVNVFKASTTEQVQEEAEALFIKYIQEGSPFQVNIDGVTTEEIKEEIKSFSASRTTFDKAQKQIHQLLKISVFPRFANTIRDEKVQSA